MNTNATMQNTTGNDVYFVRRTRPFASPLPGEPDPCGVEIYAWDEQLGCYVLSGCMHLRTAVKIHGEREIREA